MSRASNVQRAAWRSKCREALAAHLETHLHLKVDPEQVRLQPDDSDGYQWLYAADKAYLFQKPLSKLNLGTYKELYEEIGKSLRPALPNSANPHDSTSISSLDEQVGQERTKLRDAATFWQEMAEKEKQLREEQDDDRRDTRLALSAARDEAGRLAQENGNLQRRVRQLQTRLEGTQRQTENFFQALQNWRQTMRESDPDEDNSENPDEHTHLVPEIV